MLIDNEIIKALEWLEETMGVCSSDDEYIYGQIILDLINRQKAEIERLTAEKENLRCVIEDLSNNTEHAKVETVKEYREKAAIKLAENARSDYWHWIDDTLYEVEKEMVGEQRKEDEGK